MVSRATGLVAFIVCLLLLPPFTPPLLADEIWVPPTSQQDLGGLEIANNTFWPVTPAGAVRLAWAVPNNLQTFQGAKVLMIPGTPGGAASINVFVCAAQNGNSAAAGCAGPFATGFTGVANQLVEVEIGPSLASRIGAAGANYLTVLAYTTPTTSTDHIVGMRFRYTPTAPSGVATLNANTFSGTQTAPQFNGTFVGDGSALTNLPVPAGVATLGSNTFSGTQTAPAFVGSGAGLTNLPFPAGAATLGANTFTGTQTIDAGSLDLDASTATTGNITKNGMRFLHNFGSDNTFLGTGAGNFTMTGPGNNVAIGASALAVNTTGERNTATGSAALSQNTSGIGNTATGRQALASNTTGDVNTANGYLSLSANTTGQTNTASGYFSLAANSSGSENSATGANALSSNATGNSNTATGRAALQNTTGSSNVGLGRQAGRDATTGSFNIYLGADVLGVAGESNSMYLGKQGQQTKTVIAGIRGTPVTGGETVFIDANGRLGSGPVTPGANSIGTNEVIDDSLTASDLAPNSVGSSELAPGSVSADKVAFNYAGSASAGGAASNLACVGCVDASEVSFSFVGTAANTFNGTQTIDAGNLDLDASTATTGNITKDGVPFLHNFGADNTFLGSQAGNLTTSGLGRNAALGYQALSSNTSGSGNTANGYLALTGNTTGVNNTAAGLEALRSNTTGIQNTAMGAGTLSSNTTGEFNTAVGLAALSSNINGFDNTAIGRGSLINNTMGASNTASGVNALFGNTAGDNNVAVGHRAGFQGTGSNNIYLGALVEGVSSESNAMYLGLQGTLTKTVIAGIRGTTVTGGEMVVIDANGRLGSGPVTPGANSIGTNEVINDSLTASDLAPNSVGSSELAPDSVSADKVAFNYAGSASEGGAASDLACVACVGASEVSFSFTGLGANTFNGTQTIDNGNLDLDASTATTGNIMKNGARFLHNFGVDNTFLGINSGISLTSAVLNTAVGAGALFSNQSGFGNTAVGGRALQANTGGFNTAIGLEALANNTFAAGNTATGYQALFQTTQGANNTAMGYEALEANTSGNNNTAVGIGAMGASTTGLDNSAFGSLALRLNGAGRRNTGSGGEALFNNTGDDNTAVGFKAGQSATTGSNNIYLGANVQGIAGESDTMYLGRVGTQTKTIIAGVRGTTVTGGEVVVIDAAGRLGSGSVSPGANSIGTNEVINDSLTQNDLAPDSVGPSELAPNSVGTSELAPDSVTAAKVEFNYAGSVSEGGAASNLACVACVDASEVSFAFVGTGANTFTATQTIDTGNLDLDNSTAATGTITKNGTSFLHNFGTQNTFLGINAGNFSMTGFQNVAVGLDALRQSTSGQLNTAVGIFSLTANTSGSENTAIGGVALQANTTGTRNTAVGMNALSHSTTANNNTGVGHQALSLSTGGQNTAVGSSALTFNVAGTDNTASGHQALMNNTDGGGNTAVGGTALRDNTTGGGNTANGYLALLHNTTASANTALGESALGNNTIGQNNVALGFSAGSAATTGSFNIYLGSLVQGVAGESNTMYLGRVGTQTKTLIAGVRGITTGVADAIPVVIDSNGQLGTISSSIRFKEDIHDMAGASRRLLKLRPVTFRYTQAYANGTKPVQFGLVAEEVADVFPELAVRNADGQVETVHYETLNVLLLNELQEQVRVNEEQQQRLEALERKLNALLETR